MEISNEAKLLVESNKLQKEEKRTFVAKIRHTAQLITVEPCVLLYLVPNIIAYYTVQNLYLDKACRVDLKFNSTVCDALRSRETESFKDEEIEIEQLHASINVWKNFIQAAVPAILVLFVGAWSDRTGLRKPCLLMPLIGDLIAFIGYIAFSSVLYNTPLEYFAIFECFFPGLGGRWTIFLMGVYSYVADITTEEERTVRVGATNMCLTFSIPLGTAISGFVLKWAGFTILYSLCLVMTILTLCYVCFVLRESPLRAQALVRQKSELNKTTPVRFFDFSHIKDTFSVVFLGGTASRRIKCVLILFIVFFVYGPQEGEITILLLYTRFKLNWNEFWFSMFNTFVMLVHFFGNLVSVSILSGKLKFEDATIGFISSASKILSCFVYAFATLSWHLYIAAVVDMFNGTSYIALRAIASKLVPSEELGKLFSVFGFIEALMPMIFQPVYLKVYQLTLETFPGADYMLSAVLTITATLSFIYFYKETKRNKKQIQERELEDLQNTRIKE